MMPTPSSTSSSSYCNVATPIDLNSQKESKLALIREAAKTFASENMDELKNQVLDDAYSSFESDYYEFFRNYIGNNRDQLEEYNDDLADSNLLDNTEWKYFVRDAYSELLKDADLEDNITDSVISYFIEEEITKNITSMADREEVYEGLCSEFEDLFSVKLSSFLDGIFLTKKESETELETISETELEMRRISI